jgi:uncharacterized MnhB-related membrane protein
MTVLIAGALLLAALSGLIVIVSRDPNRQIFAIAANGIVLSILFFVLQAPDVALSEIAVGTVATPLLFLVTLMAIKTNRTGR